MRSRNRVLRFCENCIYGLGWSFMAGLCGLIMWAIGFAFYQLFLDLLS